VETAGLSDDERLAQLMDLEIDIFVCGAIDEEFLERVESYGIRIIRNVAAEMDEVLSALVAGTLQNGFGLATQPEAATPEADRACETRERDGVSIRKGADKVIDCIQCVERVCLSGGCCTTQFGNLFPLEKYAKLQHSMEVTIDISAETDRKLCRIAEFIYYCIGMEYKHIGVAFCVEMFKEAEILTRLLRRFFKVSPVCCKIGGHEKHDLITASHGILCNPIGQARVLNELKTDINVSLGLCIGVDLIYAQHSVAPTSTLFVKDKSLANNPVSALFSKYYINEILREI
jgi:uncharacterized metal-binding protein